MWYHKAASFPGWARPFGGRAVPKIRSVLFDLDGTLIDTNRLIIESFQYTLKRHLGREVPAAEIVSTFGRPLIEGLRHFSPEKAEEMLQTYRRYNEARHDATTTLIPGVRETLSALKGAGLSLAVVTSKRRGLALRGLRLFNLEVYMDAIVTPEDTVRHKPEPDPVLKALELLRVNPKEALMVGDSPLDLACARAAGTYTAAALWSALPRELLLAEKPDFLLTKMTELLEICLPQEAREETA
ncbi:MAG: pyrophosphatase PpaX [Bacillota bacterium]|nr:pyrophosphatase PpaX [Bacillota bacterium]